jgi:hypothetical protein
VLTSNILKGGALIDDARRLVDVWDLSEDAAWNLRHVADQNLLAKPSRARADAVLQRVLQPRLVDPGPQVIAALRELRSSPRGFVEAYYFESTRADGLLAACAEGPISGWWEAGRVTVDVNEVVGWLVELAVSGQTPFARGAAGLRHSDRCSPQGVLSVVAEHCRVQLCGLPPARKRRFLASIAGEPGVAQVAAESGPRH